RLPQRPLRLTFGPPHSGFLPTNNPPGAVSGAASVRQGPDMAPPDGPKPNVPQTFQLRYPSGAPSMCDYSLHLVASRPAKVGDKLVATDFVKSITGGFAAVGEPDVAVCLLPGTEVAFENEVECEALGFIQNWMPGKRLAEK